MKNKNLLLVSVIGLLVYRLGYMHGCKAGENQSIKKSLNGIYKVCIKSLETEEKTNEEE